MRTFEVQITRTTFSDKTFKVEAETEEQAYDIALQQAYDTEFSNGNAEYEIDFIEELIK